jgi:cell division transport system permease protein
VRLQFVLSEIGIGLRRNLGTSIAMVVTVAISLAFAGAAWLLYQQVDLMKGFWYDRVEISIFLTDDVTQQQRDAVLADLEALPQVEQVFYESKQQAFENFQGQFEDSPELLRNVTPEVLPESFRVKLVDPEEFALVGTEFVGRPGVEQVQDTRELLSQFFTFMNALIVASAVVAAVLVVAAVILIYITVRFSAFSRRRETGIMRLVGASNVYIRLPFLLEGAVAGLVGAALAAAGLTAFHAFFIERVLRPALSFTPYIGWSDVLLVVPALLLLGAGLAALASLVSLQRHLKV